MSYPVIASDSIFASENSKLVLNYLSAPSSATLPSLFSLIFHAYDELTSDIRILWCSVFIKSEKLTFDCMSKYISSHLLFWK